MGRLGKLLALPAAERRILCAAWWWLLAVDLGLRVSRLETVSRLAEARPKGVGSAIGPDRLAALVDVASRHHLYPMLCLRRALVLKRLLAREGVASQIRLGVRKEGEGLSGHAWIEIDGCPVGEAADLEARFSSLVSPHRS